MIRFLILSGYFELMMYLQVTGKLNQFINIHYRYLAILSMIISLLLALVQLYFWVKQEPEHHHDDEHQHGLEKKHQRVHGSRRGQQRPQPQRKRRQLPQKS